MLPRHKVILEILRSKVRLTYKYRTRENRRIQETDKGNEPNG